MNHPSFIKASSFGGYITSWSVFDPLKKKYVEIFYQGRSLQRTGIPVLFPCWSTSGTTLRRHGFGRDFDWKTVKKTESSATFLLDSRKIMNEIQQEFPYDFRVRIVVTAKKNNLFYSMKVDNKGTDDMPISPAIHPYFYIKHEDKKFIKTIGIKGFSAHNFNWDNAPPDNDYSFRKKAEIFFPGRKIVIEDLTKPSVISYMVVWSQTKEMPDSDFICFEPLTALVGAIAEKKILVRPKETWEMKLKITTYF